MHTHTSDSSDGARPSRRAADSSDHRPGRAAERGTSPITRYHLHGCAGACAHDATALAGLCGNGRDVEPIACGAPPEHLSLFSDTSFMRLRLAQELSFRGHLAEAYRVLGNRESPLFAELAFRCSGCGGGARVHSSVESPLLDCTMGIALVGGARGHRGPRGISCPAVEAHPNGDRH